MKAPAATERLNDGQRAALDLGRDLLVSAGAGAGKTQVLGLRYLAILEEGLATVPEIVAFTFTEKASAEMRERVQELLLGRSAELDTNTERFERLRKAQAEFSRNRISTIHGFCHRLLRDYAWEAGIEPRAPILDERAQALAREAAIRRVLLKTDAEAQPELASALVRLGSEVRLFTLTQTLGRMIKDRAAMRGPLQRASTLWQNPQAEIARRRAQWQALCDSALVATLDAVAQVDVATAMRAKPGDKLRELVVELKDAAHRRDGPALSALLLKKDGEPRSVGGGKGNWKHAPDMLDVVREQVWKAACALAPVADVLEFQFDDAFETRAGRVVRDLALVFDQVCSAYEEECAGGLDFLDLELRTCRLLRENVDVRREVIRRARFILIDEYQDTNPVQAELFALLTEGESAPGRFFAVGDAKQSIYAFRGSDVAVFNRALDAIPVRNATLRGAPQTLPWGLTCKDTAERRSGLVHLEHNYRTVKPVLELGNTVFRSIFGRESCREFDARPQDMLPGAEDHSGGVELHLLPDKPGADADRKRKDDEAELVAQRIKQLRESGVPYSDIVILVRRRSRNWQYRNAFARHNLPLVVVGEGGLFETQEALDCVNLLRALANPADDVAMLGLLRSPLAGLSDIELTNLAMTSDRNATLFDRVMNWCEKPAAASEFLARLAALQSRAGRDAPALLLTEALSGFGYALAVGCGPDAEQRLSNVTRILELVRRMQHETPSLGPLVRELMARIERAEDETQGTPRSDSDGVRLMTIHRAKGLEFPVVIVPDLGSDPGGGDSGPVRDLPVGDDPLGVHLKSLDNDDRGESRCDFAAWFARREGVERAAAEERRILYVAWTRAARRLVLVGTIGDDLDRDRWAHQLLRAFVINRHDAPSPHAALEVHWHKGVQRAAPRPHTIAIEAVRRALDKGQLALPAPIDTSLVAPLGTPLECTHEIDPAAAEIGTVVHAALEHRLRAGCVETGVVDARADRHVTRAVEALATLKPARRLLPECEVMTAEGVRRFDLLRELDGDQYEIIDYKTDTIETGLEQHAELAHGAQLRLYGRALTDYLALRGRAPKRVRLLVCFTAPDGLRPGERLVEIPA
jgi:ATP-dependent helicase/nuclease subunit A